MKGLRHHCECQSASWSWEHGSWSRLFGWRQAARFESWHTVFLRCWTQNYILSNWVLIHTYTKSIMFNRKHTEAENKVWLQQRPSTCHSVYFSSQPQESCCYSINEIYYDHNAFPVLSLSLIYSVICLVCQTVRGWQFLRSRITFVHSDRGWK